MAPSIPSVLVNEGYKHTYAEFQKRTWAYHTGHLSQLRRFGSPMKLNPTGDYFIDAFNKKIGVTAGSPDNTAASGNSSLGHLFPPDIQNTNPSQISILPNFIYGRTTQNLTERAKQMQGGTQGSFLNSVAYKQGNMYTAAISIREKQFAAPLDSDGNPIIGIAHSEIAGVVTIADGANGDIAVKRLELTQDQMPYEIFTPSGTWPNKTYVNKGLVQVLVAPDGYGAGTISVKNVSGGSITTAANDLLIPAYAMAASAAASTNTNQNQFANSLLEWVNQFTSGAAPRAGTTLAGVTNPAYTATKRTAGGASLNINMLRGLATAMAAIAPALKIGQQQLPIVLGGTTAGDPQAEYVKPFQQYFGITPDMETALLGDPNTKRRYNDITEVSDPGLGRVLTIDGVPCMVSYLQPYNTVVSNNADAWDFDFTDYGQFSGTIDGMNMIPGTPTAELVWLFHAQEMLVMRNMTGVIIDVTGISDAQSGLSVVS